MMNDIYFTGRLGEVDPDVQKLVQLETERQIRKLILIPSESSASEAVREALGSVFQNLYAEGYPSEETRWMTESEILDYPSQLSHYRRYSDPRYYKGVEYADIIEALARRRCAELFAANGITPDELYVNVQPLSGAPANNAVYTALLNPGDTLMGMNLLHGGHLSHGSPVNRSGKIYHAVHYTIDSATQRINYDQVQALANETKPKIIVAGFSSYPWIPDWKRFREIADSVGAYLLADISHIAGMVAAGTTPSPVRYAHIVVFTTHKSMLGPRGACILTHDSAIARKIDKGVFPGEQGGPHVHTIAALAVAFKLAQTPEFRDLQAQIIKNCIALADQLKSRGFKIPFGGTETHLLNLDCKTITGPDGTTLSGDMAARIMDLAGLVVNRNTIPGDKNANNASGVRMGTPWVTQRGMREDDMSIIADIIADLFHAITPYTIQTQQGPGKRAKVDFAVLQQIRKRVSDLARQHGADTQTESFGYPHFYALEDRPWGQCASVDIHITGNNVRPFVNNIFFSDVEALQPGAHQPTRFTPPGSSIDGILKCVGPYEFIFQVNEEKAALAVTWLRDLSDGFVQFDADPSRRIPGPVAVTTQPNPNPIEISEETTWRRKPYGIGLPELKAEPLPEFTWQPVETQLQKTVLNAVHHNLGAKMVPFAGWEMPVWYSSVLEEHLATRNAAGLFDVTHMGVLQAEGPDAALYLDSICGNEVSHLEVGESLYTHMLDPHAEVIDDLIIYRRAVEKYLIVVNAANEAKDWAWMIAVKDGKVLVDLDRPGSRAFGRNVILRNLRDPKAGADMRVDLALQGPKARDILLALGLNTIDHCKVLTLKHTHLCEVTASGIDLVVSRTGYTGEKIAYELFVHPDQAVELWSKLMIAGAPFGLLPCGLASRDSLRTEAGLPLYGLEMAGESGLGVGEAGFGHYVKTYKPWFIGRDAFIEREKNRKGIVVRFRFTEKGVRKAHFNDPVLDHKGKDIGFVTSCAIDSEGYLTGQAFVDLKSAVEGTPIEIFQGSPETPSLIPADLKMGETFLLPTPAVVISRFPKK